MLTKENLLNALLKNYICAYNTQDLEFIRSKIRDEKNIKNGKRKIR